MEKDHNEWWNNEWKTSQTDAEDMTDAQSIASIFSSLFCLVFTASFLFFILRVCVFER